MRNRISGAHGHHKTHVASVCSLLNRIDYSKPRGEGGWSKWASDVRQSQPENWDYRSSKWHSSAGDDRAWKHQGYDSSEWDGSKWSAPTTRNLSGSGYDTNKNWKGGHTTLPTISIKERSQPTPTPEDDMKVDPSMPVGSTSKTSNPRKDGQFWSQADNGQEWTQSSSSSTQWRPKLRHEKYYSAADRRNPRPQSRVEQGQFCW